MYSEVLAEQSGATKRSAPLALVKKGAEIRKPGGRQMYSEGRKPWKLQSKREQARRATDYRCLSPSGLSNFD